MNELHETLREWISEVLKAHRGVMAIALRQRAKFEGWLKFELAAHVEASGATQVTVEAPLPDGGRSDLSFDWNGARYDVELKTPNTNWRMPGVAALTRPVTKNFSSIVSDARKATAGDRRPIVAFVIFPVPCGDPRWHQYLERVGADLKLTLSRDTHATQITLPISERHSADVVICCFPVSAQVADELIAPAV
ncbi:MAG: hypothetical protein ACT4P8_11735 [Betaproteobacteria bacterium]